MPTAANPAHHSDADAATPGEDLAAMLGQLPACGAGDDVTRLMELYEVAERGYRSAAQAKSPRVGSSASANC